MEEKGYSIAEYATGTLVPVRDWCPQGHDHGLQVMELHWYYSEPTTVFVYVQNGESFVVARDLLLTALRCDIRSGYPVIGEGNVQCQINQKNRFYLEIRYNGGNILIVERPTLTDWVTGTYAHVPEDREEQVLDIDTLTKQLLNR